MTVGSTGGGGGAVGGRGDVGRGLAKGQSACEGEEGRGTGGSCVGSVVLVIR